MAYFFKLPSIAELTIAQQSALNEPNAIAISGGPGTGKSMVSLWRHIRNHTIGSKRSLLLTYTKTLEQYLAASAMIENTDAGYAVNRVYWWTNHNSSDRKNQKYDEIIIDEAQDIDKIKYHLIKNAAKMVSYGADDQQILYPEQATTQEELANIFENNQKYFLDENFRNSYEIMLFIKAFFKRRVIDQNILDRLLQEGKRSRKPRLLISNSINKQEEAIIDIINNFNSATHNIAILVPFKDDVERYSMLIENAGILCSSFSSSNESINKIENIHITSFFCSKGLEFDTVIIPNFETALSNVTKSRIITSNDYYVAITRAKRNLYLISSYIPAFLERSEQQKLTYDKETL